MTEVLFRFAGGTAFLVFSASVVGAIAIGFVIRDVSGVRIFHGALILLIAGILLSAPPFPRGILPVWTLLAAFWWIEVIWRTGRGLRLSGPTGAVMALATFGLVLWELPYLRAPELPNVPGGTVYVVGDSLSAGIGRENQRWPELLEERKGTPVFSLARPGARLSDGLRQVRAIDNEGALVLVLLGGNDVLHGASHADFERDFRLLLDHLAEADLPAVVFELPVIIGFRSYGRIQRRLVRDYDVPLVPARILSRVFSTEDGTSDGIHLTDSGHRQLARQIAEMFSAEQGTAP